MREIAALFQYGQALAFLACCGATNELISTPGKFIVVEGVGAEDFSLCYLMSAPALDGILINNLIAAAEKDLHTKNIKVKYRLVRVVDGPKEDEVSILFENLTYTDLYEVYVGSKKTHRINRTYGKSAFEYPLIGCG